MSIKVRNFWGAVGTGCAALFLSLVFAACGDDDSSFAPRDDESSSSIEDVTPQSSEGETSVSSSSKNGDA